jgi:hypothetical protein
MLYYNHMHNLKNMLTVSIFTEKLLNIYRLSFICYANDIVITE